MVESGAIHPVVYKKTYHGLQDVRRAMEDLDARKVYGRAVVKLSDAGEAKSRI
jgi:NADPH:quinone reductase